MTLEQIIQRTPLTNQSLRCNAGRTRPGSDSTRLSTSFSSRDLRTHTDIVLRSLEFRKRAAITDTLHSSFL